MKEIERLSSAVAKLGAAPESRTGHGRVLTAADRKGLLKAVLGEIDETVLARELQLRNDRGEEIRLEVSGRRLLRVASVTPKEFADTWATMLGKTIVDANGAASRALVEVLGAMATGSPAFAVTSRKLSQRTDRTETGCSPEALLASWNRLEARPERANPVTIADFITRSSSYATAFILLEDGRVVQEEGEQQVLRQLTDLSRIEALRGGSFPPGQRTKNCVLLTAANVKGDAFLYACDGKQSLLLLYPARLTVTLVAHWSGNAQPPTTK